MRARSGTAASCLMQCVTLKARFLNRTGWEGEQSEKKERRNSEDDYKYFKKKEELMTCSTDTLFFCLLLA